MKSLTSYPNIGAELAKKLNTIGINSIDELSSAGSENAFIKIKTVDPTACINLLYALEGAIQGIRWHGLPEVKKQELREFFKKVTNL